MHHIIYLSTFFPPELSEIQQNMKTAANISASAFSYSLLMGLVSNVKEKLTVINTPLTGPYPLDYKKILSNGCTTSEYGVSVKSVGAFNLYGLQGSSICHRLYRAIDGLNIGSADIIVYSIQLPLLDAAVKYKQKHQGSHIILVVPDLYEDLGSNSKFKKTVKNLLFGDYYKLSRFVDAYVLLTPLMIEKMPERRPFCVVEGIYNPAENRNICEERGVFTILYSGMLYKKFGVKNLVDAVHTLELQDVRLKLCGSGELVEYIKTLNDSRIEYLGIVSREKVLQIQSESSLLINPRQPNGEFTRYSFPSKNIEYLASGTPTLIYELEGIPQEYYQYCYHLPKEEKSVAALAKKIKEIYNTNADERKSLAMKAQTFIFKQKNAPVQCEKIISLIENL